MTELLLKLFTGKNTSDNQPETRAAYGRLAGFTGLVCNLLLALGKLLAGWLSGSIAIMADAVNNLSDAASSVITLVGFKLASKPADREHPFGHARFEYIAGLAVALLVMVIGFELGESSVQKILEPAPVSYGWVTLAILGASITVKLWMMDFNRKLGRRIGSQALEATAADSRNDALSTAAVLMAALVAKATGLQLDGWIGLAVAVFILISGFGLVRETLNPLLGEAPDPALVQHIKKKIESYDGVLGTHDLILHDYGPGRRFASAHVEMSTDDDVLDSHDTIDNIERYFLEQENLHLIIHYDPVVTGDEAVNSARNRVARLVQDIDPRLTIHDFRMVDGPSHTNYIFDVVVPPEFALPQEDLLGKIEQAAQHGKKPVHTVVTIDESYAPIPQ